MDTRDLQGPELSGLTDSSDDLTDWLTATSTAGRWSTRGVMLSARQHKQAVEDGAHFWLYVVENALDDDAFAIHRIQDPARRIDYFGFDVDWKRIAESG